MNHPEVTQQALSILRSGELRGVVTDHQLDDGELQLGVIGGDGAGLQDVLALVRPELGQPLRQQSHQLGLAEGLLLG